MKYLIVLLFLSGCTFHVETRSDKEIERYERTSDNKRLFNRCIEKCEPFNLIGFNPVDHRCLCGELKDAK